MPSQDTARQEGGDEGARADISAAQLALLNPEALTGEVIPPATKALRWYDLPRKQSEELAASASDCGPQTTDRPPIVTAERLAELLAILERTIRRRREQGRAA